jgi:putative transposase
MTAPSSIDPAHFLLEQLTQASADLLRRMLTTFIHTLMSAEADAVCGAEYRARSEVRTNVRDGYRSREFNTRAGTLAFAWRRSLQWSRHLWKDVPPTGVLRVFRSSRHRRR